MPESAAEISEKPEVKEELARATGQRATEKVAAKSRHRLWFLPHILLLIGCALLGHFVGSAFLPLPQPGIDLARRAIRGTALIIVVLAIGKALKVYALARIENAVTRFTLQRIQKLLVGILIAVIAISVIFVNWYAAVTALGVGSIVIGLAVQTPMKSFVAWIYILVRQPYRVGDRIKIGEATGDVIDVGYLDTTLWEFGGQYLSTDHPSGRVIKFPNEKVLDSIVWNYSWPLFPYIWNEIKFQIAYQSDLKFVAETMERIVNEEIGEEMVKRIDVFRELLAKTPVDEVEVRAHPRVFFRVDEVTWVDAIVRYCVPPREAGRIKNRLIPKLLAALNAQPEKVMFPVGANR
ncbi:MAG: mechanosensitive ion channel family protein [Chthoniobacterales bacterium]